MPTEKENSVPDPNDAPVKHDSDPGPREDVEEDDEDDDLDEFMETDEDEDEDEGDED